MKLKQVVGIHNYLFYDSSPYSDIIFAIDVVRFCCGYNIFSADCTCGITGAVYSGDTITDNTGVFLEHYHYNFVKYWFEQLFVQIRWATIISTQMLIVALPNYIIIGGGMNRNRCIQTTTITTI